MKLSLKNLIAKHPDNTNGLIAFLSTFLFVSFIVSIVYIYMSFYNKAIDLKDKDDIKASISFNAADENNPRFGYFQLGAIATHDKFNAFEDNYLDHENNNVDFKVYEYQNSLFGDTIAMSGEQHRIYDDIDAVFHIQFKDNQLIYIKHIFVYEDTRTCEVSFGQLSTRFSKTYGELDNYYNIMPNIKLHATYKTTYLESNVIDDKFAVSIEHNCVHGGIKYINVRMGYLPSIINKRKLDALQEFNTSF